MISAIREYPPCVTDCEEDGSTALHHASIFNHELTVYVLLSNQADPNALEVRIALIAKLIILESIRAHFYSILLSRFFFRKRMKLFVIVYFIHV